MLRSIPVGSLFNIVSFGSTYAPLFGKPNQMQSVEYTEDSMQTAATAVSKFFATMGGK